MFNTKYIFLSLVALLMASGVRAGDGHAHDHDGQTAPIRFIENKKQWDPRVKFKAEIPGGYLYLSQHMLTYDFFDFKTFGDLHHSTDEATKYSTPVKGHIVQVFFEQAKAGTVVKGEKPGTDYYNYFLGNDPARWSSRCRPFEAIEYQELYAGINLHFHNEDAHLKYEFVVAPGADPAQIRLRYEGAEALVLENGDLIVKTSLVHVTEEKPYTYQIIGGRKVEVPSAFVLHGNVLSYAFPQGYDPKYPLVIDPRLAYATFSGSAASNYGNSATPDQNGMLFSAGTARDSGNFPTTPGAYQTTYGGGIDVGLLKYNPNAATGASSRLWATYIGGSGEETPHSMIVNVRNELVLYGQTASTNFPTRTDSYKRTNGGGRDIFIAVLSVNGDTLKGATYLGGSGTDGSNTATVFNEFYLDQLRGEVFTDTLNNIYIASMTTSATFDAAAPAFQTSLSGTTDGIIAKLNPYCNTLNWWSYIGGSGDDVAYGVRVDRQMRVIVAGGTTSTNFPTTAGAVHTAYRGGTADGFVTVISPNGQSVLSSTFVGTTAWDRVLFVDVDQSGEIYVLGQTEGSFPVTPGAYSNPNSGQFIQRFNNSLTSSSYSTVVGTGRAGQVDLSLSAFLVSDCGTIYMCGWGGFGSGNLTTTGLPTTINAFQRTTNGNDFYLMILGQSGTSLSYATFVGGTGSEHVDGGTSRFDKDGTVYQAVCTNSSFPTTPNAWSSTVSGWENASFKFDQFQNLDAKFEIDPATPKRGCAPLTVSFRNTSIGGQNFVWNNGNGSTTTAQDMIYTYAKPGRYIISLQAANPNKCPVSDIFFDTVTVFADEVKFDYRIIYESCEKAPRVEFTNLSSGIDRFVWELGTGDTVQANLARVVSYTYPRFGEFEVKLTGIGGNCSRSFTQRIVLPDLNIANAFSPNGDGKNERFEIPLIHGKGWQFAVTNRWGQQVFTSDNYRGEWDGNGLPAGQYFYDLTSPQGNSCKGVINIVKQSN